MSREEYESGEDHYGPEFDDDEPQCCQTQAAIDQLVADCNERLDGIVDAANSRIDRWRGNAMSMWMIALVLAFILGGVLLQPR